jgi:hypothetical protein
MQSITILENTIAVKASSGSSVETFYPALLVKIFESSMQKKVS